MPVKTPKLLSKTLSELQRLEELMQQQDYDEALGVLRRAALVARQHKLSTPFVYWQLAVVHDNRGELLEALGNIQEALRLDPVCPHLYRSYDIIIRRMRSALCGGAPELPALYAALQRENELDADCHLAHARHLLEANRLEDAGRLLGAVTVLSPACPEAWALQAQVLRKLGREADALESEATARRCEAEASSFPVPTQAEAAG